MDTIYENVYNTINHNKTYHLCYVYNGDFTKQKVMEFTADEILEATTLLPMYVGKDISLEEFNEALKNVICASGRTIMGKSLNTYHEKTIRFVQCANQGCKTCFEAMRNDFAMYMALNIEDVMIDEIERDALFPEKEVSQEPYVLYFIFDNDYSDMDYFDPAKLTPQALAFVEQQRQRQQQQQQQA